MSSISITITEGPANEPYADTTIFRAFDAVLTVSDLEGVVLEAAKAAGFAVDSVDFDGGPSAFDRMAEACLEECSSAPMQVEEAVPASFCAVGDSVVLCRYAGEGSAFIMRVASIPAPGMVRAYCPALGFVTEPAAAFTGHVVYATDLPFHIPEEVPATQTLVLTPEEANAVYTVCEAAGFDARQEHRAVYSFYWQYKNCPTPQHAYSLDVANAIYAVCWSGPDPEGRALKARVAPCNAPIYDVLDRIEAMQKAAEA